MIDVFLGNPDTVTFSKGDAFLRSCASALNNLPVLKGSGFWRAKTSGISAGLSEFGMSFSFASDGFSASTKGRGFSSVLVWAYVINFFQVMAGRRPPVRRFVGP